MALISNLVARLTADTGHFEKGMSRSRRSLTSFSSQVIRLAAYGGGLYGLIRATRSVVSAAVEQEKAEINLAAALGDTDFVTRQSIQTFKTFAAEMQRQTIYGDELILSQMAYAKNLGVTEDKLKDSARAAIGLAAAYRIDLQTAMMLVGRASQGQTQMLTRYGIVLEESLSDQEKFNKLLEIGASKFDLAEAEARSAAGTFQQWKNASSDLKEEIGQRLLPTLTELTKEMTYVIAKRPEGEIHDFTVNLLAFGRALKDTIGDSKATISDFLRIYADYVTGIDEAVKKSKQIQETPPVPPTRHSIQALELQKEHIDQLRQQILFESELRKIEGSGLTLAQARRRSEEEYARMFEHEMEKAQQAWDEIIARQEQVKQRWREVGTVMEYSFTSAFDKIIWEAENWRDAMLGVAREVIREMLRALVIRPFVSALTGGVQEAMFTRAFSYHKGGVVGDSYVPYKMLPTWAFAGAPRLHGGLRADEYPAILQKGETVIEKGGGVNIILQNQTGVPMRSQGAPNFDGRAYTIKLVRDELYRNPAFRADLKSAIGVM